MFSEPCLRKHLGDGAIPPLIEQHLLVNAWGPPPGIGGHCELFLSKCCTIFMKKERRRVKEGGPLLSRKGLRVQRKRSMRSDVGKKHNYKRKNTRTSQLRSFGNARSLERDGKAAVQLSEGPSDAEKASILNLLSPPKKRRQTEKCADD